MRSDADSAHTTEANGSQTVPFARQRYWNACVHFCQEDDCSTAVEYAVMLALILMTVIASIAAFGQQSGGMWGGVSSDLNSVGFGQ